MYKKQVYEYDDRNGEHVKALLYFKTKVFNNIQPTNIQSEFGMWKVMRYADIVIINEQLIKSPRGKLEYLLDSFLEKE